MTTSNPSAPYFDKIADKWDSMRSEYFTESVREKAIQKAYLHPEMIVADVGAGTGFITAGLASLVKQVHLIDGSEKMIKVARENLKEYDNIEYHHADGQNLPLPDSSVDTVFANMFLHHCPDPLMAIKEMVRVLRPAGRLIITDLDKHSQTWLKEEMADLWKGFDRGQIREWFEKSDLVNTMVSCTGESCKSDSCCVSNDKADISILLATGTKRVVARDSVQDAYSSKALSGGCGCSDSSCCSPGQATFEDVGSVTWDGGYSTEEKSAIPIEAADISLGCGNPIAMAGLQQGETVLDIGSGGGIDVFLAAKKVGPTGLVYGIDMTPAMLQLARKAALKGGYTNVKFRFGYAENLPVEDGSIDVIISNCVINLTEDKGKVFKEAYRVLKSSGRLEVNDMVFGGPVLPEFRVSKGGWSECISGALPEAEYIDLVRSAGFSKISVRRSTSHGIASDVPVYSIQVSAKK